MQDNMNELMEKFMRVTGLLHRQHRRFHEEHGPMGNPHRGQGRVLALLKMQPEISQRDLSYLLDMRAQSLGELLAKLERAGFIERNQSEQDKRVLNIRLTEAGRAEAEKSPAEAGLSLFASLSDEERETLGRILDRVIATLEESLGDAECCGEQGPRGHGMGRHGQGQGHGRCREGHPETFGPGGRGMRMMHGMRSGGGRCHGPQDGPHGRHHEHPHAEGECCGGGGHAHDGERAHAHGHSRGGCCGGHEES